MLACCGSRQRERAPNKLGDEAAASVLGGLGVALTAPEQVASHYDLGVVVGSGHFAEIRETIRRSDGKKLALKFIDKKDGDGKFFRMVQREARLAPPRARARLAILGREQPVATVRC